LFGLFCNFALNCAAIFIDATLPVSNSSFLPCCSPGIEFGWRKFSCLSHK
jgi:hypothetical protein